MDTLKDILKFIGLTIGATIIGSILFLIIGAICMDIECKHKTQSLYEYKDLDNNIGEAQECSYKFEGYKRGGQGSPVCITFDNTTVSVKEYKIKKYIKKDYCK